jgi:hypothetical protein
MTSRYFVGDKDKDDINLNDLILNKDSVEDKSKSNKIIKKWNNKKDNNFDRKLFSGDSVISEDKLKKYKRGNELNIVIINLYLYFAIILCQNLLYYKICVFYF